MSSNKYLLRKAERHIFGIQVVLGKKNPYHVAGPGRERLN